MAVAKAPKVGGEIVGYCTKCRMMLNHRIGAMVGTKAVRVICLTCGSEHNYRARAPGETAERAASAGRGNSAAARATRAEIAEKKERDREAEWAKAITGKGVHDFKKYTIATVFAAGELVRHTKFGDGVVTNVIDANKIEVLFKEDTKTLAHAIGVN